MVYTCSVCGRVFSRRQNLNIHMQVHNKPRINSAIIDNKTPIFNDTISRINMLEDAVEHLTTGTGFIGQQQHYNPYIQQQQLPTVSQAVEDSFDKLLKQYMQIMMIKQLSSATNSNSLTDFIKMQSFMDGRDEEEEPDNPLLNALIQQLAPQLDGVLGTKKKVETGNQNMNNLPPESELLSMNDNDIVKLLIPYRNQMKQLKLTQEQAYQNILNFYPNFPEERFNKIWSLLLHD